jgi:tetratricopeptide (TPR) repeat protein
MDQVQALGATQSEDGPLLRIAPIREALGGLLEAPLGDLTAVLADLSAEIAAVGVKVDAWGGALQEDLDGLGAHLDHRFDQIFQILRALGLGIRVTPNDQFVALGDGERGRILVCQAELARLPRGRGYSVAALAVGSAVSASGAPDGAEALFDLALETAEDDRSRALAHYNLFQARLRQGPARYPQALAALRQAEALDAGRYATHEGWKYQVEAILGAGAMGCALRCRPFPPFDRSPRPASPPAGPIACR